MKTHVIIFSCILIMALTITCSKSESKPECQKFTYGTLVIYNKDVKNIVLFISSTSDGAGPQHTVTAGKSITYTHVQEGSVYVKATYDGYQWKTIETYITSCEQTDFSLYGLPF